MTEPPWKRLVDELSAQGHESPHLERLRERLPKGDYRALELEIAQEMASALGRAGDKVDHALLKLEVIGRRLDQANDAAARVALVHEFNTQREVALHVLWELKVHREATDSKGGSAGVLSARRPIGLRQHHTLAQLYPVPPKRR